MIKNIYLIKFEHLGSGNCPSLRVRPTITSSPFCLFPFQSRTDRYLPTSPTICDSWEMPLMKMLCICRILGSEKEKFPCESSATKLIWVEKQFLLQQFCPLYSLSCHNFLFLLHKVFIKNFLLIFFSLKKPAHLMVHYILLGCFLLLIKMFNGKDFFKSQKVTMIEHQNIDYFENCI